MIRSRKRSYAPPRPVPRGVVEPDDRELLGGRPALRHELLARGLPAAGRPAELERLDGGVAEAATAQVVERRLPRRMVGEDGVVEGDRPVEDLGQALAPGVVAAGPLVELDPGAGGEDLERVGERHVVTLHDEAEDVAAQPAAEALPALASRGDVERRRLLTVERAETLVGAARLLQLNRVLDDVHHAQLALDFRGDADGQLHLRPARGRPNAPWRLRTWLRACQDLTSHIDDVVYHTVNTPGKY